MSDASAPAVQRFADATCDRLTQLLLELSALDSESPSSLAMRARYQALMQADAAFSAWSRQCTDDQRELLERLPERLARERGWEMDDQTRGFLSPAAERLLAAASVVLRLQTLSKAFAEELASQKRQAVYNFAYGLSHELNNPLANIATRAGVLAQAESNVQRRQMLEAILENAMRGSEMLGDLMLLARPPAIVRATTPAVEFLDALVTQANAWAAKRSVEISLRHAYDGPLLIDAVAMREAIWALLRNAVEAMPDGGMVHMQTTASQQGQQGWYVMEIVDQGAGLSSQALEHCFDPYYSGREAGRGLGLGLGKAQRIIDMHQGRLTLANLPGSGCKARIELPVPATDL